MTPALLDVNVLLALLDSDHVSHSRARSWFAEHAPHGWATCAITENGAVRIISHPSYPNPVSVSQGIELFAQAAASPNHSFWPDDVSLLDARVVDGSQLHGHRQITDAYLLALAVRRGGRLATFDSSIPLWAVPGATPEHVALIG